MYTETLAPKTKSVLNVLSINSTILEDFYLSGGTALALHLGHRESEDLDFFSQKDFDPQQLQQKLEIILTISDVSLDRGTLNCYANGVKLQFLHYPYKLLDKTQKLDNLQISSMRDIACTKLITISARGSQKDFIDLFFILQAYNLRELFELLKEKYPETDYNLLHILKSLVFFEDADHQPSPKMHKKISWPEIKKHIAEKVKSFNL